MLNIIRKMILICVLLFSQFALSAVNINVKIGQVINDKIVEFKKTISAEFNKDIVIQDESLKDKIVLSLKKFSNVLVNGNKIEPIQISVKRVDSSKKIIGKPQTITSFYRNDANFNLTEKENPKNKIEVNLGFIEIN